VEGGRLPIRLLTSILYNAILKQGGGSCGGKKRGGELLSRHDFFSLGLLRNKTIRALASKKGGEGREGGSEAILAWLLTSTSPRAYSQRQGDAKSFERKKKEREERRNGMSHNDVVWIIWGLASWGGGTFDKEKREKMGRGRSNLLILRGRVAEGKRGGEKARKERGGPSRGDFLFASIV